MSDHGAQRCEALQRSDRQLLQQSAVNSFGSAGMKQVLEEAATSLEAKQSRSDTGDSAQAADMTVQREAGKETAKEVGVSTAALISPAAELASREALHTDANGECCSNTLQSAECASADPALNQSDANHIAEGRHLLLTLHGCKSEILNSENSLRELVSRAAAATHATVLQILSYRFTPQGVTVLAVLAESHASLHTYPESSVVFWDCFTCGTRCNPELSADILIDHLEPTDFTKQMIVRR